MVELVKCEKCGRLVKNTEIDILKYRPEPSPMAAFLGVRAPTDMLSMRICKKCVEERNKNIGA